MQVNLFAFLIIYLQLVLVFIRVIWTRVVSTHKLNILEQIFYMYACIYLKQILNALELIQTSFYIPAYSYR